MSQRHPGGLAGGHRATRRDWLGLAVLALPCLLYSMDLTVLNLAVPQLTADLKPSASQLLWIVDVYGFLLAGFLITMGTLGDRIGRRRLLLFGAAAFGAASILAAASGTAEMLIASRALLGIAAATLAPSTLSLIRNMFLDPRQRAFAIGVWVASFSAGAAIAPLIGGAMLTYFWWGSVFLLAVPVMLLLLVLGPVLLPEFRDPEPGPFDPIGVALSLAAVLAVIYGLKQIAQDGFGPLPVLSVLAGVAVGCAFVRRQQRLAEPLIDLALFRTPGISASLAINILALFIAFGSLLFIAQYLQLVLGMTPLEAGLWTVPSGIAFVVGSLLTPLIMRRVRPGSLIAGSFALSAAGFVLLAQVGGPYGVWILMSGLVLFCVGLAPVGTVTTDLIVGIAPPERAGAASAISETSFEFGGALGIAVLGSLVTAAYRGAMADAVPPGIPADLLQAAQDTLGAAVAAARIVPGEGGTELLGAAREAFTRALKLTAVVCAAIALAAAAMAAVLLRRLQIPEPGT